MAYAYMRVKGRLEVFGYIIGQPVRVSGIDVRKMGESDPIARSRGYYEADRC